MKMMKTKAFEQWLKEQAQMVVRYRQIEKSDVLAEYNSLKKVVDSAEFQAKKKELTTTRYADTQEGKTMTDYKYLRKKSSVFFYRLLKKAAWKEKPEVAQYLALEEQIQTPEFKQANAFWKNPKRWFTTPESQQEMRFNTLAKHADIVFYLQQDEKKIAELESYKMVWADEFDGANMADTWQTGFLYPTAEFKADHSHVSEQQAYVKGQNTKVNGSAMHVVTKKQSTTAPAWHPTKGMIIHHFAYTSDVWHTTEAVAPKSGVLQVKVRLAGKAKHIICLTKENTTKALHLLPAEKPVNETIYTLVWNEKEVVNYVNDVEVARSQNPLAGEALHLLVRSYLPENQKASAAQLDIDWVRIYTNA
jgi:hypothetical protein